MKVLITGAVGQVGHALVETAPSWAEAVPMTRAELDLTDAAAIERAIRQTAPDVVINAAAYTAVDRAESEEERAFAVNAGAVAVLAATCDAQGARLVHISTDFVFDGAEPRPYRPDDTPAPLGAYGRSKLAGEEAALKYGDNLVVRTAWVYGNRGRNFVKTILRRLEEGADLRVVADQRGTPTHARSLARAIWALIERGARGLVHVTDAGEASWHEFAAAISEEARALGLIGQVPAIAAITTAEYPTPAARPAYSVLDCSETWALLGTPARDWRVELREMLAGEARHG